MNYIMETGFGQSLRDSPCAQSSLDRRVDVGTRSGRGDLTVHSKCGLPAVTRWWCTHVVGLPRSERCSHQMLDSVLNNVRDRNRSAGGVLRADTRLGVRA